jgi:hypothetical protein
VNNTERRRYLSSVGVNHGWRCTSWECWSGDKRPPERWYRGEFPEAKYTVKAAYERLLQQLKTEESAA